MERPTDVTTPSCYLYKKAYRDFPMNLKSNIILLLGIIFISVRQKPGDFEFPLLDLCF